MLRQYLGTAGANFNMNHKIDKEIINININYCMVNMLYSQKEEGLNWYSQELNWCKLVSIKFNLNFRVIAALYACFSPLKSVDQNKALVLEFLSNGCHDCGHLKTQVEKAKLLVKTEVVDEHIKILSGRKTINFYKNISGVSNMVVTIDRHVLKLAPIHWNRAITPRRYDLLEECIQSFSSYKKNAKDVQAQLWVFLKTVDSL